MADQKQPAAAAPAPSLPSEGDVARQAYSAAIDKVTLNVSAQFAAVRAAVDAGEKLMLQSSARVKAEIGAHVELGDTLSDEANRLRNLMEGLQQDMAASRAVQVA